MHGSLLFTAPAASPAHFPFHPHTPCRVFLCAREWENPLTGEALNISDSSLPGSSKPGGGGGSGVVKAANLVALHADGAASLADGSRIEGVDVVMFCTGYE